MEANCKVTAHPQLHPRMGIVLAPWVTHRLQKPRFYPQTSMKIGLKEEENNQTFKKKKKSLCFENGNSDFFPFLFSKNGLIGSIHVAIMAKLSSSGSHL